MEVVLSFKKRAGMHSIPLDGSKLDTLGHKGCTLGALGICTANFKTILDCYQKYLWEWITQYIEKLPILRKTRQRYYK